MGSRRSLGLGVLAIGLGLAACTPSPAKVCEHANTVMNAGRTRTAEQNEHDRTRCVADLTTIQSQHAAEYKTAAKCMMDASTRETMMACMMPLIAFLRH
ncbi:MAG: hypothetical protein WCJ30_02630 [Deltaproteobacteria bacterium]